jgi:glycine hydroxymethyltransferase
MIKDLIKKELARQKQVINLIPSENYPSKDVLAALASQLSSKYAEGKAHQRYYFGNKFIDGIEDEVGRLALKVFNVSPKNYSVNVQPYSGSTANLAIYLGALKLGDKILAMSLGHGGHLSHGHSVSLTGKLFKFEHYGVARNGFIDYDDVFKIAKKFKPKMVVCGATAYPRKIDFRKFRQIADSAGALMFADISHIAGLIAGRVHSSPFPYADIAMTTTQKTLRGPRGAIIIAKKQLFDEIDKTVFPGLQGGPHLNVIAAIGICLEEALRPAFKKYAGQVVKNAKVLAGELKNQGFKIISGGTDNHIILIDVALLGLTGKQAGEKLEKNEIIVNKNMIPFDTRKPWDPSGIRLGTPAETTRGAKEKDMVRIAKKISSILNP